MASMTLLAYFAVLCILQFSPAEGRPARESNQMADFMARRNLQRRDTASVEDVQSRSQKLKARMSSAIQNAESEVQERSEDIAAGLQDVIEKVIDAGTRMIVERMESEAAGNAQGQASQ